MEKLWIEGVGVNRRGLRRRERKERKDKKKR
jgi:hypothetical protein